MESSVYGKDKNEQLLLFLLGVITKIIALNIAFGSVGSIVATAVYQIKKLHSFPKDYPLVILQIEYLDQCVFAMYKSLSFLVLWSNLNQRNL